ncbi:MAG: DUF1207 domain-containing protein [Nitrospirae bacterium]|nr:DUF1207 domain-containing protein [Nitrospirota bacterium]
MDSALGHPPSRLFPALLFPLLLILFLPEALQAAPPPSATVTLDQDNPAPGSSGVISLQNGDSRLILFPAQDVFTPLLADPREPLTTVEFFAASNHPSYLQFNGNLAANVGIARWESTSEGVDKALQIGVMGGDFSRFGIFGANTYLIDSDFLVGVPVTARVGRFSQRLFFYHESSHTGYNYTVKENVNKLSDFGQEILQEVSSWDLTPYVRLYGGVSYRVFGLAYYPSAQDSLIFQGGIEAYTPTFGFLDHIGRGYTSLYLESRGINGYALNEDFQLGLLFHRPGSYFDIRPMIDMYNGYSYLGDLLFTKDQYAALGVSFDF